MNRVILHDPSTRKWLRFDQPSAVVCATRVAEVRGVLMRVEEHIETGGWAAGFLSYEASPAFDPTMTVKRGDAAPLAWFGLFDQPTALDELPLCPSTFDVGAWTPALSHTDYLRAISAIKEHIRVGDTYQVNFTFPLLTNFRGDPEAFFHTLLAAQPAGYAAFVETPTFAVCSVSPELFFEINDGRLVSRPMKGTRRRGVHAADDLRLRRDLLESEKDRAENLMIVDMIRNDMSRVAEPGTVAVLDLYTIEQYPTVLQMTSTVVGDTTARWSDIVSALFPCASITGAPKIRTMEIIADLEERGRGLYTGALGFVAPGGFSRFSVAIRTAQINLAKGEARYDVGGGIVWDSDPEAEYEESHTKAAVLTSPRPSFSLLETMRYEPGRGILFLERHLARMSASAAWFGFGVDLEAIRRRLETVTSLETNRIRLLLDHRGTFEIHQTPMRPAEVRPVELTLARTPIDPRNPFVHHKTTNRAIYEKMFEDLGDTVDDVILFTPDGYVTETTRANLALRLDGRLVTPALSTGLLPGVLRADCVERGLVEEAPVSIDDLSRADEVFVLSALRGFRAATRVPA